MSRNAMPSTADPPSRTSRCDAPVNTTPPGIPDADFIDSAFSPRLRSTSTYVPSGMTTVAPWTASATSSSGMERGFGSTV